MIGCFFDDTPEQVGTPTATAGVNSIDVEWSAPGPGKSAITAYYVRHKKDDDTSWPTGNEVTDTSTTISGLAPATTYNIQVQACNNAAGCGDWSDSATIKTNAVALSSPPAPTGLTATASGTTSVNLSWSTVSGVDKHWVERRTGITGSSSTISSNVDGTSTTYSVTSLSPDTTYYFRVSAYGDGTTYTAEWSTASGTASAKTNQAPPATPTGLSSTAADGTIELTWTAVTGATAYVVHQWHGQTLKYIQLAFKDPTTDQQYTRNGSTILKSVSATTATIGGLTNGTSYTHQVRSKNSAGQSVTSHRVV